MKRDYFLTFLLCGGLLLSMLTGCKSSKKVGTVDFQGLAVRRISDYKGASKRHGHKIYVTTNLGRIAYSVRRKLWTCVDLWADEDAPVKEWGEAVLKLCQLNADEFVRKYAESG